MKILKAYLISDATSGLEIFKNIAAGFEGLVVTYQTFVENTIDAMNRQLFDLLILDKALPGAEYNKLLKLATVLHPDAAIIELRLMDEDFIKFKLGGIMLKWQEAQSDSKINFIDAPKF